MLKINRNSLFTLLASFSILAACSDDDSPTGLRPKMEYTSLNDEKAYSVQFLDVTGLTTVDSTEGNTYHKMFQAHNYYSSSSTSANAEIDAVKLNNLFSNSGNPFVDISTSTISVNGATLNASGLNLRDITASSLTDGSDVIEKIESHFDKLADASLSIGEVAEAGQAGKLGNYLVDERGIEHIQIIQKSLIGALELDYIGNVLLSEGLDADNSKVVTGKNYTALEHNWDVAYSLLTLNPVYLAGSTDATRGTTEFGLGAYTWEYNKANYANMFAAFLKGRAAIVNNDKAELEKQALFIRTQFEIALAKAALGYLDKWKTGTTDAARAHAIGEGLGFIYSLRFATVHTVDATFSDELMDDLIGSENGFWDLTADKINAASDAINDKFDF
ncbi:MAG TPA: DUF4856 domain-containing protein [Chryseolinea sp.]|nr:DUF4856 domain-containing protein [Chryseolinea sp.]